MRRIFRFLVCFLVICALLVNASPIKSEATAATTAVVGTLGVVLFVGLAFQALGILPGADPTAFNTAVNDCSSFLEASGYVYNGLVSMLQLTDGVVNRTYADQGLLQKILDWLWNNEVVITGAASSTYWKSTVFGNTFEVSCETPIYFCVAYSNPFGTGKYWRLIILSDGVPGVLTINGEVQVWSGSGSQRYLQISNFGGPFSNPSDYGGYLWDCSSASTLNEYVAALWSLIGVASEIVTSSDLILGSVGQEVETDYEAWVEDGVISVDFGIQFEDDPNTPDHNEEDNNKKVMVPLTIPSNNYDDILDQTQEEAQSGESQVELDTETDTGDDSGSGDGSDTGTDSGSSGGNSGSSWTPPSDHSQFALADLKDFFPFCIPFDLYNFFTLLSADPVAPVLNWEIQDLAGQTYSLSVDLSEWDSVAQLFRRLQLFLFVCGLAAASRKFIKW